MNALEIINVSKSYGDFNALDNVSMCVQPGDFVGLLGVNGAGKTSLISAVSGVNKFSGSIKVMGYDVIRDTVAAKKNLGIVPQEVAIDPFLTVWQTLTLQSGLYGAGNNKEWLFEILERLHLHDKMNTKARGLSGGMKRRLMVAQALVHRPPVIILDEPTAGVDVEIRKSLWGFIRELNARGHTILLTTHYLEEVEALCNKIVMIDKGKIINESSKTDLIEQAQKLSSTMQIETRNGQLSADLQSLVLEQDGNLWTLRLDNSEQLLPILSVLHKDGIIVDDVRINRPKLEDIFINYLHR